jgi:hypothetical protein
MADVNEDALEPRQRSTPTFFSMHGPKTGASLVITLQLLENDVHRK